MMLFIMSHSFVKAIVFIDLIKAISFSILLTFRISAMRLFKFMNFFSLDLNFYNLNISRMWLIYTLLFLKMESLLADLRIPNLVFRYSDWKTLFFNLKYLVFRSKPGFHIEKLGISIEIPGYSTEILDFSKRCDKWLPQPRRVQNPVKYLRWKIFGNWMKFPKGRIDTSVAIEMFKTK